MGRAKSSTAMGREHEERIVKIFDWDNAYRSRSSGASFHDPVDVTSDNFVIECEATEAESYRFKLKSWFEVRGKQHSGKRPMWAVEFRDIDHGKHLDLVMMDANDVSELMEELEAYRKEALERG